MDGVIGLKHLRDHLRLMLIQIGHRIKLRPLN